MALAVIRVLALFSLILLAGCTATGMTATPIVIANVGPVSLSFADFPDAPNRVQDNFYSTFAVDAPIRGIPFDPGDSGTVVARGYLSVAGSASGTLLIYVFDFVDQDGNRLTRVGGQMSSPQAPEDPWDAVDNALIEGVVSHVLDEFRSWLDDNRVTA